MNAHKRLGEAARERVALYVLGCLEDPEHSEFVEHLAGCAACRREIDSLEPTVTELVLATAPVVAPPRGLGDRLMARARGETQPTAATVTPTLQTWKNWVASAAAPGINYVPASDDWEAIGVDGVEVRRLFVDIELDRVTMLVRMQAGASYPAHRHGGREECYVLEGDLWSGDRQMRAGDYLVASEGSVHGMQKSDGGCLALIVSSRHDDLLPGHARA